MTFQKYRYYHMLSYHMLNTMRLTKRIFSFFKTKDHLSFTNLGIHSTERSLICTRSENQKHAYKTTKNNKMTLEIIGEDDNYSQYSVN